MNKIYNKEKIEELEDVLNIKFHDKSLLQRSITHKSFPNENPELNLKNNERLEFLGDAVLNLTITSYIFRNYPDFSEGKLAKMKAVLVSSPILAKTAQKLNINRFLLLGRGEEMTG
ncbi:MAG: ribonuclease III family protein, partial [Halanaerobiales bacterium]